MAAWLARGLLPSWEEMATRLRTSSLAASALALAGLTLASGAALAQYGGPDDDRIVDAQRVPVHLEVETDGEQATFRWRVDAEDVEVVCTLDVDSDRVLEESIEDCEERTSLSYTYDEAGTYVAKLLARTHDGRSGRATARVHVD